MPTDRPLSAPLSYLDVGVRPSRRGVERAAWLASVLDAPLRILGAFSEKQVSPSRTVRGRLRLEYMDRLRELARSTAEDSIIDEISEASLTEVLGALRRQPPRMVVTSGRTSSPGLSLPFRPDLIRSVMRDAPAPVLILPPVSTGPVRSILAAVDLSAQGEARRLAHDVLHRASEMAHAFAADLSIVHAWTLVGEGRLTHPLTPIRASKLGTLRRTLRDERRRRLDELLEEVPQADPAQVILGSGTARDVVRRAVHQMEADVLVLGHSRRAGLSRFLIGDLSETLLGTVATAMLVVHGSDPDLPLAPPHGTVHREMSHGEG